MFVAIKLFIASEQYFIITYPVYYVKSNQIKNQFLTLARFLSWLVEVEVAVELQASPSA